MLYGTVVKIGVVAAIVNVALCTIALLGIFLTIRKVRKEGVTELTRVATILPTALDSISHSELPVTVVAAIGNCMKVPINEIIKEYREDSSQRRYIALRTFRSDPLTWQLIRKFPSKFIAFGYVGEELINKNT